jgi:CIC family chloride channel protein
LVKERRWRLLVDTLILGIVGALSARLFVYLLKFTQDIFLTRLAGYQPPGSPNEAGLHTQIIGPHGLWLIPVVTTLGGLLSGILVYSLAPESEGHGTDTVVKAFHRAGGFIRARVAPIKLLASAITIGSGGSAGREGPTALISAGIGSIYATLSHRSDEERRLLVLIGTAAGLSAIFRSPIGTAIFAIEVLYSEIEFESGALLYTMLGAVVAYAINGLFVGWKPLFYVSPDIGVPGFYDYGWYAVLGIASGFIAVLLPFVFYSIRDLFHKISVPPHLKPAIGGFGLGLIALFLPQVLGGGYGWIQQAIDGNLGATLLIVLLFAKILAFSLTVSSGGSGGVFAPSLFVGAMLGGFLSKILHQPSDAFVIVGMTAVFGGAARVPVTTLLMVPEMTGGYQLLVPASLAVMISYLVQVTISKRLKYQSLYEAQVPTRADSPAHHIEHMKTAMRLLNERRISLPRTFSHLNLYSILTSGIPVHLPDGKQLTVGVLKPESSWVGKTFETGILSEVGEEMEIIAIFRNGHLIFPHPDTVLESGEQVLIVATNEAVKWLVEHISPIPPGK